MTVAQDETTFDLTVEGTDAAELDLIARDLCSNGLPEVDDPRWVAAAREAADAVPVSVRRALRLFRRHSGDNGTLLIRGMPVDEGALPPTPIVEGSVQRRVSVPAAVLMMVACALGEPVAFRAEKSGALVQDVVPVPGREEFQGNAGSVLLTFHNENAFHRHRPDYLIMLCLRADHDRLAGSRTACVRRLLPGLSEATRQALFAREFATAAPPSFGGLGPGTGEHAVLFGAPEDPDIRVDLAATAALTPRAAAALGELGAAFDRSARVVPLAAGDLVIVDNRVAVHGRTSFRPRYDGFDRWLQRTFVAADLRASRDHRPRDGYVLVR